MQKRGSLYWLRSEPWIGQDGIQDGEADLMNRTGTIPDLPRLKVPCIMVIFGSDGDLTKRKLIPALYTLLAGQLLPSAFAVVGLDRTDQTTDEYRAKLDRVISDYLPGGFDRSVWQALLQHIHYLPGDFKDGSTYRRLNESLQGIDTSEGTGGNYLFYMATVPALFGEIVRHLGEYGLAVEREEGWRRVVIEKPFGHDVESAKALNYE